MRFNLRSDAVLSRKRKKTTGFMTDQKVPENTTVDPKCATIHASKVSKTIIITRSVVFNEPKSYFK